MQKVQHGFSDATPRYNGDERSSRDPRVWAKARKQHIANAVAWYRHYFACKAKRPEGVDFGAILKSLAMEIRYANTTLANVKRLAGA